MRQAFKEINLRPATMSIISSCNRVIAKYQALGLRLTLRQLYYQFIANNLFPDTWIDEEYNRKNGLLADTKNTEKNYKSLGKILADGRLAGYVDWDAIEDRTRQPNMPLQFRDLKHRIDSAIANYRLPRWSDQEWYVELWVEKDALAGVLEPLANEYHVPLMVNRGYSSMSSMYESANRFVEADGRGVVLYIGDHDPSGEDMVRDVRDRLNMFADGAGDIRVVKIALTKDQIEEFDPPPNPTKPGDSRSGVDKHGNITNPDGYVARHGWTSWEVDALDPEELARIVGRNIAKYVDQDKIDAWIAREDADKKKLLKAYKAMNKPRSIKKKAKR